MTHSTCQGTHRAAWYRVLLVLTLVSGVFAALPAWADPTQLATLQPSDELRVRLQSVQYQMISGRVLATSVDVPRLKRAVLRSLDGRRQEQLTHSPNNSLTNLDYLLVTPKESFSLVILDSCHVVITRSSSDGKYQLKYEQEPGKPISVSLLDDGVQRSWQGISFWHVYLEDPQVVRTHLIPILEVLRPSWELASMGKAVEDLLFRQAQTEEPSQRERWSKLVEDLSSSKFSERQTAERELYDAGQAIVPFLQNLNAVKLDAEQTYRVRSLISSLFHGDEDSADRLVFWLSADPQVWVSLLGRSNLQRRKSVARQLASATTTPIEFDPEADEEVRSQQIERLRSKLHKAAADNAR